MRVIKNNLYILRMVYAADKRRIIFMIFLSLISTSKNIINVLLIKLILDCIIRYQSFSLLALFVLAERIISTILSYCECLLQWEKCPVCDSIIKEYMLKRIYTKSLKIQVSALDYPEFYDKFTRAIDEAERRAPAIIATIENFMTSVLTIFSISTIIILLDWKLIFLSLISAIISVLINIFTIKLDYKKSNALTRPKRKIEYVRRLFYLPQYIEEMKTNNYNKLLFTKIENGAEEYNTQIKRYQPEIAFFDIIRSWQTFVINFGIASVLVGEKIVRGVIDAASFTSLIYASATLSGSLSDLFSVIPQMAEHSLFVNNLREILEYKSSMESTEDLKIVQKEKNHSILLDNVSFRYNSSADNILKNISLRIDKGEKIALVGENGAGKSTLIKLILRLYDPQSGSMYLDEENYKDLDVSSLRQEIAVVYQDFQAFAFSIGENVLTKELGGREDEDKVWEALKKSGLSTKIENLPDKLNTPLTDEFEENGISFSGGENQKLAIARAMCKDAGVIIMDEPSSSLDPLSEYDMYLQMLNMCRDKTLILISHRLYSTKMVDKIYYMESGSILECGSHEELMKQNGKYARMYHIQAEQYG
ncbi:ABC transporter ATP-binding protein/permease [Acetatifactor muris]|uniref:Multidrug export ATP-binding/permease protein n=1 Tax=Acetatifactor muris TaxID=879566 RepID=A0A2K4ZD18_9FIRM|nr:ABC transporter ATP-binding protein [Acetatifactor muris]MCR2046748.1 ABC transporter ATP-binding protein/permease [Acetatifactor muris]SOY28340.1 Putative multidrug export ATP-binding/permease protein [Acetatifactor muris]